jgi:hypothetical protein
VNKGQRNTLRGPSASEQVAALEQRVADLEADNKALVEENTMLAGKGCEHGWNLRRVICPHGCRLDESHEGATGG